MDSRVQVGCIIPVAGASSRMGRFKPLLPWGGSTIISTVVANALAARSPGLDLRVIIVTGNRASEIESELDTRHGQRIRDGHLRFVHNEAWEAGQTGSIQRGMAALGALDGTGDAGSGPGTTDADSFVDGLEESTVHGPMPEGAPTAGYFFVMLADMPLAASGVYAELAAEAARRGAGGETPRALLSAWEARAGHPVLIPLGYIPTLLQLTPDAKIRPRLEALGALSVPTACEGVTIDIDTEEAYLRYTVRS